MDRESRKKLHERIFVELFLKQRGISSSNCKDYEEPDFLITDEHGAVGIEVTQLFQDGSRHGNGSQLKAGESRRAKSIQQLAQRYYKSNVAPLQIDFAQYTDQNLIEANFDHLLRSFEKFGRHDPWSEGEEKLELPGGDLLTVYWCRLPDEPQFARYSNWKLINDRVGFAGALTEEIVANSLNQKREKAGNYLIGQRQFFDFVR